MQSWQAGLGELIGTEMALVGENPDAAMARVLYEPEKASRDDYFVADRVYGSLLKYLVRAHTLERDGYYSGSSEVFVNNNYSLFACPYGLAFLDQRIALLEQYRGRLWELHSRMRSLAADRLALRSLEERETRAAELLQSFN